MNSSFKKTLSSMMLLLMIASTMSGCKGDEATSSDAANTTKAPVGDFNFVDGDVVQTTRSTQEGIVGREDGDIQGGLVDVPDTPENPTESESGEDIGTDVGEGADNTTSTDGEGETAPEDVVYTNDYVELSTTASMRLGKNVYISIPTSLIESYIDIDTFNIHKKEVSTLVSDTSPNNKNLMERIYENGACVFRSDKQLMIDAKGVGYWVKNQSTTLNAVKTVSIADFNTGTLSTAVGNTYSYSYSALGEQIETEENEYFYYAAYDIKDFEGVEGFQGIAMVLFDKTTEAATFCVLYTNPAYDTTLADFDVLVESFRYQTVSPDNVLSF